MDVWTLMRTALRRWYVFIPVVGASLAFAYSLASDLDPVYTAESSAILIAPEIVPGQGEDRGTLVEVNPYLNLGGGLQTATQVMAVLMDSGPQRLDYIERGLEPEYEVTRTDAVIFFEVTGTDEASVTATANELVAIADDEIAVLQDRTDIPDAQRIQVRPLSLPEEAVEDGGAGIQLIAILGVLGLVAGLGAALALDGLMRSLHRRRAAKPSTEASLSEDTRRRSWRPRWLRAPAGSTVIAEIPAERRADKGKSPAERRADKGNRKRAVGAAKRDGAGGGRPTAAVDSSTDESPSVEGELGEAATGGGGGHSYSRSTT